MRAMAKKCSLLGVLLLCLASNATARYHRRGSLKGVTLRTGRYDIENATTGRRLGGKDGMGSSKTGDGSGGSPDESAGDPDESKGSGSTSGAWVDGEYYGCLALSQDKLSGPKTSGSSSNCEFVSHSNATSRTGSSHSASATSGGKNYYKYQKNGGNKTAVGASGSGSGGNGSAGDANGNSEVPTATSNPSGYGQQGQQYSNVGGSGNQNSKTKAQANEVISSVDNGYSPYTAFNVTRCDTYEKLWTWDIKMSCGNSTTYSDCRCTFAERLMQKGLLSCADSQSCPKGCPICSNCLKLLGCGKQTTKTVYAGNTGTGASSTAAVAAVFSVLVGATCCAIFNKNKKDREGKLSDHLIDGTGEESQDKIWMVPVDHGVPDDTGTSMRAVWLAPEENSVSTDESTSASASTTSYTYPSKKTLDPSGPSPSKYNRSTKKMLQALRFPDILAPVAPKEQVLPRQGVPTVPTDMTSVSTSNADEDIIHSIKKKLSDTLRMVNGVWLIPEWYDDYDGTGEETDDEAEQSSTLRSESLSELHWSGDETSSLPSSYESYEFDVDLPPQVKLHVAGSERIYL